MGANVKKSPDGGKRSLPESRWTGVLDEAATRRNPTPRPHELFCIFTFCFDGEVILHIFVRARQHDFDKRDAVDEKNTRTPCSRAAAGRPLFCNHRAALGGKAPCAPSIIAKRQLLGVLEQGQQHSSSNFSSSFKASSSPQVSNSSLIWSRWE